MYRTLLLLLACVFLPLGQVHAATERDVLELAKAEARHAFLTGNYDRLEAVATEMRVKKLRTESGLWQSSWLHMGIRDAVHLLVDGKPRDSAYESVERKLQGWLYKYPNSPTAYIVYSNTLINHGWAYRGEGAANTVRADAWPQFFKYLEKARVNLQEHKAVAAKDPEWYVVMMLLSRAQERSPEDFLALLDEATKREPLYFQTYFEALNYLLPEWGGNVQAIENFASSSANLTKNEGAAGLYARIYWVAYHSKFKDRLFLDSLASWPRMKAGFDEIIKKYPDAWNLNNYAKFACLANDKPKTKELLAKIGTAVTTKAWGPAQRERCDAWARTP